MLKGEGGEGEVVHHCSCTHLITKIPRGPPEYATSTNNTWVRCGHYRVLSSKYNKGHFEVTKLLSPLYTSDAGRPQGWQIGGSLILASK